MPDSRSERQRRVGRKDPTHMVGEFRRHQTHFVGAKTVDRGQQSGGMKKLHFVFHHSIRNGFDNLNAWEIFPSLPKRVVGVSVFRGWRQAPYPLAQLPDGQKFGSGPFCRFFGVVLREHEKDGSWSKDDWSFSSDERADHDQGWACRGPLENQGGAWLEVDRTKKGCAALCFRVPPFQNSPTSPGLRSR